MIHKKITSSNMIVNNNNNNSVPDSPQPVRFSYVQLQNNSVNLPNHQNPTPVSLPNISLRRHKIDYNPYKIPADWKMAQEHGRSVMPGKMIISKIQEMQQKLNKHCPCCNQFIHKNEIGYCEDIRELAFLGDGFPLFYNFLQHCGIMLFILLLIEGAVQTYKNMSTNKICSQGQAQNSKQVCAVSTINDMASISKTPTTTLENLLHSLSFIGQLGILIYFRHQQSLLADNLNERNTTPSDYTLVLTNIPKSQQRINKINIERFIKSINHGYAIQQILLINSLKQFYELQQQLKKLVKKKQDILKNNFNQEQLNQIDDHIQEIQQDIAALANKKMIQQHQFNGMAFIVFKHSPEMIQCCQKIQSMNPKQLQQKIIQCFPHSQRSPNIISVQQANQPDQYDWENIHLPNSLRYLYLGLCILLYAVILAIVTVIFYFIIVQKAYLIQHHAEQKNHLYYLGIGLGYAIVVIINIFNKYVLSWIAHIITDHEKHIHFTSFQYSFAMKYMLGMFFTTALMTLMVQAIKFDNYTHTQGVIQQQSFMFIFNALFSPIMWLINPPFIIHWIKKKIYKDSLILTQLQANKIMEYPSYDMGKRYAENMKTMWFTFLYVSLIPVGIIFSLAGIIIYYLVDKYVLLYRSSVTNNISNSLSLSMLKILEFTLVLKSAGQLLFATQIKHQFYLGALIRLIIGLIFVLLPLTSIFKCIWRQKLAPEYKSYEQTNFDLTYRKAYPLSKYCQDKQLLIKQAYLKR